MPADGRDGQIRTADLSLRRRPLYPSELRPRIALDCISAPALQALCVRCRGGNACRRSESCRPPRRHCRSRAARSGPEAVTPSTRPPAVSRPSRAESSCRRETPRVAAVFDSVNRVAGANLTGISVRGQHHAHRRLGLPAQRRSVERPGRGAHQNFAEIASSRRCIRGCVSGSPRRTLNSRTLGPSAVIIRPA